MKDALWMAAGMALMLALVLVVLTERRRSGTSLPGSPRRSWSSSAWMTRYWPWLSVTRTFEAYALAFGPAADAVDEMNTALSLLVAAHADSPVAKEVMRLGLGAQVAVLRIETLLPPHIAEASDATMDELEARMAREDEQVRKELADLAALMSVREDPDLATAASQYARFGEIRSRILALSRENTHIRSSALSLGKKREVTLQCLNALNSLQEAIRAEPIPGVTYGRLPRPR